VTDALTDSRTGDGTGLSDEEIVRRVRAGDTGLFEILMRRHNQRLYRAARAIVRDDAEAEDVTQEAWVRAYTHLEQFAGRAAVSTWLTRIAVHEAIGRVRRRGRLVPLDADTAGEETMTPGPSTDVAERAAARELGRILEAAIDALPAPFRTVLVLRTVEEMSTADTAAVLDLPEETVKTRLHRARARLRGELERSLDDAATKAFEFGAARCDRVVTTVLARIAGESLDQRTRRSPGTDTGGAS
jgi:RNA polymerase sigma-70 factor, ECF subfamily